MFKNHPGVPRIRQEGYSDNNFSADPISELDIQNIINKMDPSNEYQVEYIPPNARKDNVDICSITFFSDINRCINKGIFPNNLRNAEIIPTFQKNERMDKTNYIDQHAFYLHFQRSVKKFSIIKFTNTSTIFFLNT